MSLELFYVIFMFCF